MLGTLTDFILPPDAQAGAERLGVVDYIEQLVTAFDFTPPRIYAAGPFSGRQPFPAPSAGAGVGAGLDERPANAFLQFVPLSRVQDAAWRIFLFGSKALPGGAPSEAIRGPVLGLRDVIQEGVRSAIALAERPIEELTHDELGEVWTGLGGDFRTSLTELVIEGSLSAPEYGGNRDLEGWRMVHFEGDTLPLGYTAYDGALGAYRERSDAPVSTLDDAADPDPLDEEIRGLLELLTMSVDGRKFY